MPSNDRTSARRLAQIRERDLRTRITAMEERLTSALRLLHRQVEESRRVALVFKGLEADLKKLDLGEEDA